MAIIDQVVSQVNNTMNSAQSVANAAVSATTTLVQQAIGTLTGYTPTYPDDSLTPITPREAGYSLGSEVDVTAKPAEFPEIRTAQDVQMGALGDISTIDDTFEGVRPDLDLPAMAYNTISPLEKFTGQAPDIDTQFDVPEEPIIDDPDDVTLIDLKTEFNFPNIDLPEFDIIKPPRPKYNISGSFAEQFAVGQSNVPNLDDYSTTLMNRLFPNWETSIQQLYSRINGILSGSQTALTDTFEERLYEVARGRIQEERDKAIALLDEQTKATGFNLPGPVRAAGMQRIQQEASSALQKAALEINERREEMEVKNIQFIIEKALPLHQAAVATFTTAFDMSMKAYDGSMKYAQVSMQYIVEVYQTLQRDYEIDIAWVANEITIIKEQRNGEMFKLQVIEAEIKVESLKSDQNKDRLEQLRIRYEIGNRKLDKYSKQIDALGKTLEARKLPLDAFRASVEGYLASWQTKEGEYKNLDSIIRGDEAKIRGQLAKLEMYKTDASVFDTVVSAKSKKVDGQIKRNEQVLREFEVKQNKEVALTDIDAKVAAQALDAYKATAQIYIAESSQNLEKARLEFQQLVENSKLELAEREFQFSQRFKNLEIEITRVKSIAELQLSSAEVQGRIGAAAMSMMNVMSQLSASAQE